MLSDAGTIRANPYYLSPNCAQVRRESKRTPKRRLQNGGESFYSIEAGSFYVVKASPVSRNGTVKLTDFQEVPLIDMPGRSLFFGAG